MTTLTTKEIGYSYPSSANAVRFGFRATGCYTVRIYNGKSVASTRNETPFATFAEAKAYADTLPQVYGRYTINQPLYQQATNQ